MGLIYKVTCTVNNKKYIGQTIGTLKERKSQHLQNARRLSKKYSLLYKAIRKYGEDRFVWEIIEECDNSILDEREIFHIANEKSFVEDGGYNLTEGGATSFGCQGDHHYLNRMSIDEKEEWLKKHRYGKNNPNYGNGDAIAKDNHFLNQMTFEEREKWLDANLRGSNNYQTKMTKKELKEKNWLHKKTSEEIEIYKDKFRGDNNPLKRRLKDPEFREAYCKKVKENSTSALTWKISHPDGTIEIIVNLAAYVETKEGWTKGGVSSAVHANRLYKGYKIEKYITEDNNF